MYCLAFECNPVRFIFTLCRKGEKGKSSAFIWFLSRFSFEFCFFFCDEIWSNTRVWKCQKVLLVVARRNELWIFSCASATRFSQWVRVCSERYFTHSRFPSTFFAVFLKSLKIRKGNFFWYWLNCIRRLSECQFMLLIRVQRLLIAISQSATLFRATDMSLNCFIFLSENFNQIFALIKAREKPNFTTSGELNSFKTFLFASIKQRAKKCVDY